MICLVAGLGLVLAFTSPWLVMPGVLCLVAFVALGVFVIADPAFIEADDEHGAADRS